MLCGALHPYPPAAPQHAIMPGIVARFHSEELPKAATVVGIDSQRSALDMEFAASMRCRL